MLGHYQRTKKDMEDKVNVDTYYNWFAWNDLQRFGKKAGRVRK